MGIPEDAAGNGQRVLTRLSKVDKRAILPESISLKQPIRGSQDSFTRHMHDFFYDLRQAGRMNRPVRLKKAVRARGYAVISLSLHCKLQKTSRKSEWNSFMLDISQIMDPKIGQIDGLTYAQMFCLPDRCDPGSHPLLKYCELYVKVTVQ
jgi:hypothetical protein